MARGVRVRPVCPLPYAHANCPIMSQNCPKMSQNVPKCPLVYELISFSQFCTKTYFQDSKIYWPKKHTKCSRFNRRYMNSSRLLVKRTNLPKYETFLNQIKLSKGTVVTLVGNWWSSITEGSEKSKTWGGSIRKNKWVNSVWCTIDPKRPMAQNS